MLSMNTKAPNSNFGKNLRNARKQKGYTLAKLAEISGISKRMIGHYETQVKKPSLDKIKKLAGALNISVIELIEDSNSKVKKTQSDISYKIMKKVRVIEELPTRDQNVIFSLINSLSEKNKLKQSK